MGTTAYEAIVAHDAGHIHIRRSQERPHGRLSDQRQQIGPRVLRLGEHSVDQCGDPIERVTPMP